MYTYLGAAVAARGRVFAWGEGTSGQLGSGVGKSASFCCNILLGIAEFSSVL